MNDDDVYSEHRAIEAKLRRNVNKIIKKGSRTGHEVTNELST